MIHKELIQAVLDGKTLQFRRVDLIMQSWQDFRCPRTAIFTLVDGLGPGYEYRIKPPELPKKLHSLYLVGDEVYLNFRVFAAGEARKLELDVREVKIIVQGSKIISTEEVKYV